MKMSGSTARLVTLYTLVSAALSAAGPRADALTLIPGEYEKLNHPAPKLELVNPFFKIEGRAIKGVKYSLDGAWRDEECSAEDRDGDGKSCGKPFTISPGPHILAVVFCERADCTRFGKAWNSELRFTVGLREVVTIDLKALADSEVAESDPKVVRRRQQAKAGLSPCAAAIEQAFHTNTCLAAGVARFAKALTEMDRVCSKTWSKDTDQLFEYASWQVSWLDPERCYKSEELKKLPDFLVRYARDGVWPKGTLKGYESSWRWARDAAAKGLFETYEGPDLRTEVGKRVRQWQERQTVVDQLIAAVLDPAKNLKAVTAAATAAKSSDLNPTTANGHRLFALSILATWDAKIGADPAVKALLTKGGATNQKLHCAYKPEAVNVMDAMTDDKVLSAAEWSTVKQMIARTPADASLDVCSRAIWQDITGPVALEDRAIAFAKADCAPARDDDVRGETISRLAKPDYKALPTALRVKVLKQFADCIR